MNYLEMYRASANRISHRGPLRAGVAAPHPRSRKGIVHLFLQKKDMQDKKNPHAGFSSAFFPERVGFCVGKAQTGNACLRRHANLRFARISRSRAPERKKNAIRVNSRRLAVKLPHVSKTGCILPELDSQPHRVSPIYYDLVYVRL